MANSAFETAPTPPGGLIVQVVQTYKSDTFQTSSTSFVDVTGMTATITPTSATNKILVTVSYNAGTAVTLSYTKLLRGATEIFLGDASGSRTRCANNPFSFSTGAVESFSIVYLDSPGTTDATTYKLQARCETGTFNLNRNSVNSDSSATGVQASSIILMEVTA
jgi:hypothetical protein